ncbi:PHD finger protein rhinoceros-like isoform X2 [Zootermopsis nevadensis]|uniref:PHD finger protein rhinoceros-like isoform X2 n=1 Tax=Zootermopsis nevadensis TaxID=136037 RepID=UPI000B8E9CDA|nr:PHD finger protein rhinoceros-like isoform X2 [Zootermopsis nevadensis]
MFSTAKRKSAVELLQESKAFYVKSETVLDRKQELKNSGHLQVTSSAVDTVFLRGPLLKKSSGPTWVNNVQNRDPGSRLEQDSGKYLHQHVLLLSPPPTLPPRPNPLQFAYQQPTPPPLPPKSPRLVPAAQRRSGSNPSGDQLQTKLRRLLNADSKENLYRRLWDSDDQDVKTVAGDERPFAVPRPYGCSVSQVQTTVSCASPSNICRVHHKSLPDLHTSPNRTSGSSSSSTNDSSSSNSSEHFRHSVGSAPGAAMSTTSRCSQPNLSSSQFQSFATISHRLPSGEGGEDSPDTDRSPDTVLDAGKDEFSAAQHNSTSSYSDSGAEEPTASLQYRVTTCDTSQKSERRRPVLRSKSDISHRYSAAPRPPPPPQPRSGAQLDKFFEQLGLDTGDFRSLSAPASGSSSPVFFESVSSVDSWTSPWSGVGGTGPGSGGSSNLQRPIEQLSIVERNARIIKWLCNCRKAHLATRKSS